MAVVIKRSSLSDQHKDYIRNNLPVSSNTDPPVIIQPFNVSEDREFVTLPMGFYRDLRSEFKCNDWSEFPNDSLHTTKVTPEIKFTGTLRPYQEEVWKQTLPILLNHRTLLLRLHCGWGKTAFTAFISSKVQLKTLILYHISPLGRSWNTTFKNFTNAVYCHLGHDEYNPDAQIYISTVGGALSDKFPVPVEQIGLLAIDETHCFCSPQRIMSLLKFRPKYLVCLTATPVRPDGLGLLIDRFVGKDIETRTVTRISSTPFTVYKCNTPFKPLIKQNVRGGLDWQSVKESLLIRDECIKLICDWVTNNPHKKILIYCIQVNQIQAIQAELKKRGEDCQTFYEKDSTYNECRVLIAMDKKCQLGFDDATTCRNYGGRRLDMIILGWTTKSPAVIEQIVGRMRIENGVLVDIVHNFSSFNKHYKVREEFYKSRNGKIIDCTKPLRVE